jgi:hypothetical protein
MQFSHGCFLLNGMENKVKAGGCLPHLDLAVGGIQLNLVGFLVAGRRVVDEGKRNLVALPRA